jgi:hypothetical protein
MEFMPGIFPGLGDFSGYTGVGDFSGYTGVGDFPGDWEKYSNKLNIN